MKSASSAILAVLAAICLIVSCVYGYLHLYRDAAPQFQTAERQVFEQTPSYVQGKITYLTRLKAQYNNASDIAVRNSLAEMIQTEAATVDNDKLPPDLRNFVHNLNGR